MQTFLPYPDFRASARVLDYKRLNKQHVEAFQIINILESKQKNPNQKLAWSNHPAVLMWKDNIDALKMYADCIKQEILNRGYKSEKIPFYGVCAAKLPEWFGLTCLHKSHRSNLARKDPKYYKFRDFGIVGYYWPSGGKSENVQKISKLWENFE